MSRSKRENGKMKKIPATTIALLLASACAQANVTFIKSDTVGNGQVNAAGVYFNGQVNNQTVTWLISALAEIRENYRNVHNIDVYLNSRGGDMDAGYVAYETLRKSPITLNMINASVTASSATLIYCASPERYSMPMAQFMLHPAAAPDEKTDYIRPDQARRILEEDENYNAIFRKVYASCTSLSREELEKITDSETGRVIYPADEAAKHGLVTKGIRESHSYPLTYYITDSQG
ncbi:ATP-dependent Clp protease proteolytic subunit [Erwinia tasmaniensis]|uniref:ATP-dependent Clp protease proteolytic subunit n=1 Tax=Erwinia tasmaniensis TaxID=338565 RepID=UPI003A4E0DAD